MSKKALIPVFLIMAFVFSACGMDLNINVDRGSGNVITETREVSDFDQVVLSGIGDVTLEQGESEQLEIEAEDNLIQYITTEVRDGTLYIGFDRKSILPTETIRFYLTMREVRGLETRGVSNIQADNIETDALSIGISGTGNIHIEDLSAETLTVNVSGAGNFDVEGKVEELTINLSGAGNINGDNLESQGANITITGLGRVTAWVVESLNVRISGSGSVEYYGSPQVSQQISGLGRVRDLGNK